MHAKNKSSTKTLPRVGHFVATFCFFSSKKRDEIVFQSKVLILLGECFSGTSHETIEEINEKKIVIGIAKRQKKL